MPSLKSLLGAGALLAALVLCSSGAALAADKAPDFTLKDTNGKSVSLAQHKGSVVLLAFWATWCTPCMAEMPKIEKLYKTYGPQGFTVLSVSVDESRLSSQVKTIAKTKGVTYPVLLDTETSVVSQYNPSKTVPYAVLIDREGQIIKIHSGYNPGDEQVIEAELKELLGATAAPAATPTAPAQP